MKNQRRPVIYFTHYRNACVYVCVCVCVEGVESRSKGRDILFLVFELESCCHVRIHFKEQERNYKVFFYQLQYLKQEIRVFVVTKTVNKDSYNFFKIIHKRMVLIVWSSQNTQTFPLDYVPLSFYIFAF